jgi:RHS repeat-associated protein
MKRGFKTYLFLFLLVSICSKGISQTIQSDGPLVLPQLPNTTFVAHNGETWSISSKTSVTLEEGTVLEEGSTVEIKVDNAFAIPSAPNNPSDDLDKNWTLSQTFDEDGNLTGSTKSFFDFGGNPTQTQVKNLSAGHVLATQALYDTQGRPVINTLPAPTNNSAFRYKTDFITNRDGTPYTSADYDFGGYPGTPILNDTEAGSLAWYYSANNTYEPQVPQVLLPYTRTEYYDDGSGAVKKIAAVGDELKLGKGHETSNNSSPVINELDNYVAIRNKYLSSSVIGALPEDMAGKAVKSVVIDANGTSIISITDLAQKPLMTARGDADGWLSVTNSFTVKPSPANYQATIVTGNSTGGAIPIISFDLRSPNTLSVYRNGTLVYTGSGDGYIFDTATEPTSATYLIKSAGTFSYSYVQMESSPSVNSGTLYPSGVSNMTADYIESPTTSLEYFQLVSPSVITTTGTPDISYLSSDSFYEFNPSYVQSVGYYRAIAGTSGDGTVSYTNKYSDISYNYYNQLGQLILSIAPNGVKELIDHPDNYPATGPVPFATTYEYDTQGRLVASTSTDGGRTEFVYRTDGKIRFSQNAEQRAAANGGRFSYTNYDDIGRPFESGEYVPQSGSDVQFSTTQANATLLDDVSSTGGLTGGVRQDWVKTHYDLPDNSHGLSGYSQDEGFLRGTVSWTENANSKTWYNYDGDGLVSWVVKQISGLGNKTINYTYDSQGNVTTVDYQHDTPAERFVHHYDYDLDGRLINVQTSRDGLNKLQQAKYYYYLHGPLKRVELGDQLQGIDYTYTAQGWLKSINGPSGDPTKDPNQDGAQNSFAPDAFGMQLEYFPNDYVRSGSSIASIATGQPSNYNGNVNGISWQSKKTTSALSAEPTIQDPTMYTYGYDPKYQLTGATWGTPDLTAHTFTAGNQFKENNIAYDPNGNITALQRTNAAGTLSDDFSSYQYQSGTNKLNSVGSTASPAAYGSYTYDALGQLKSAQQAGTAFGMYLKYDVTGKITGIYADELLTQLKIAYAYDEAGNRISRADYTGPSPVTTYYVDDIAGNSLALYVGSTLTEIPVYGSDRLGTYNVAANSYVYELKDNVGSVRVVINRTKKSDGTADILTYNDYYPFGSIAQSGGTGYRYDYQGAFAEKDPVTGFNNFDLRMYDGRIGRWLSTDPAGQYASPYEGMGNNPVTGSDPTGGETTDFYKNLTTGQTTWIDGSADIAGYQHLGGADYTFGGYALNEVNITAKSLGIGQPSFGTSLIPVYGSARSSIDYFQRGKWGMGTFQAAMAVSDLFLVKSLATAGVKLGAGLIGKFAAEGGVELAAKESIAASRAAGILGEDAVGISGSKTAINVGGRTRIPDRLTANFLEEVKNVKYQPLTGQLRDFNIYSQQNNIQMILHTRSNTILSKPLQGLIDNGSIIHKVIPGL